MSSKRKGILLCVVKLKSTVAVTKMTKTRIIPRSMLVDLIYNNFVCINIDAKKRNMQKRVNAHLYYNQDR